MHKKCFRSLLLVAALTGMTGTPLNAAPINFTIDSNRSILTLSGSMVSGALSNPAVFPLGSQSFITFTSQNLTNSLQSRSMGSGVISLEGSSIQFQGAQAVSQNTGSFRPSEPPAVNRNVRAAANFGAVADAYPSGAVEFSIRGLVLDLTSVLIPLSGTQHDWSFPVTSQWITVTAGRFDYGASGALNAVLSTGTFDLTGMTAANVASASGQLNLESISENMTIPIDFTIRQNIYGFDTAEATDDIFIDLRFVGEIGATVVPEASTLLMLGSVGVTFGFLGYRRSRRKNLGV